MSSTQEEEVEEKALPPPPRPRFPFSVLPFLPQHLPLSKERTYIGFRRNTFLLFLLGASIALLVLILSLSIGLSARKQFVCASTFPVLLTNTPTAPPPTSRTRPTKRFNPAKAPTTVPVSAHVGSTRKPQTRSSPFPGKSTTQSRSAGIRTRIRCAGWRCGRRGSARRLGAMWALLRPSSIGALGASRMIWISRRRCLMCWRQRDWDVCRLLGRGYRVRLAINGYIYGNEDWWVSTYTERVHVLF